MILGSRKTKWSPLGLILGALIGLKLTRPTNLPRTLFAIPPKYFYQKLKIQCVGDKIKIKLGNGVIKTCDYDKQKLDTGVGYYLICPRFADFCTDFVSRCPLDCSGHGICLGGNRCYCFEGFTGTDCVRLSIFIDQNTCDGCTQEKDLFILSAKIGGEFVVDTTKDAFLEAISYGGILGFGVLVSYGVVLVNGI